MFEVRRGRDRGYGDNGWLRSWYTFGFADYYDPEHVDFGPLKVMNEERIKAAKGYPDEFRRDSEVLTYVIDGELRHKDSLGNETVLRAGGLQRMSAGTGIRHTESNPSPSRESHLLHICLNPAKTGVAPAYEQKHFPPGEKRGVLRLLVSPDGEDGSVALNQDARIYGGLFHESEQTKLEISKHRRAFVQVVRGSIAVNETRLNAGDGVKISQPGDIVIQHGREADVLVIEVPAGEPAVKLKPTQKPRVAKKPREDSPAAPEPS